MARGEQHARHRQYPGRALSPQPGQRLADRRAGEFEIARRKIAAPKPGAQRRGRLLEFRDSLGIAAAVTAQQDRRLVHRRFLPRMTAPGLIARLIATASQPKLPPR